MTPERRHPDDVQSEHMMDSTFQETGKPQVAVAEKPSTLTSEHQKPIFEPQFATKAKESVLHQVITSEETLTPHQIDIIREYVMDCALDHILAESKDSGYRPLITRATIDHALRETQDATLRQLGLKSGTEQYASVKLRTNSSTVITNPETLFADKSYFEELIADTNKEIERLNGLIAQPDNEKPKNNTWVQQKNEAIKLKESLEGKLRPVILQIKTHDQDGINQAIQDLQTYHQWISRGQLRALLFGESTDGQPLSVVLITTHFDDGASITKAFNRGAIDSKTATLWYNRLNRVIASYNNTRFNPDQFSATNEALFQAAKTRDTLFAMYSLDVQRNQTKNAYDRETLDEKISKLADSLSTPDWETYKEDLEQYRFYAAFERAKERFFKLAERSGSYQLSYQDTNPIAQENEIIADMAIHTIDRISSTNLHSILQGLESKTEQQLSLENIRETVRLVYFQPNIEFTDLLALWKSFPSEIPENSSSEQVQALQTEFLALIILQFESINFVELQTREFVQLCQLYHAIITPTQLFKNNTNAQILSHMLATFAQKTHDPKALAKINTIRGLYHPTTIAKEEKNVVAQHIKNTVGSLSLAGGKSNDREMEYQVLLSTLTDQSRNLVAVILANTAVSSEIPADHLRTLLLKYHQADLKEETLRLLFQEQVSKILSQLAADKPDREKVRKDLYDFYHRVIIYQWQQVGYEQLCTIVDHKRWDETDQLLGEMLANLALGRDNPTSETQPFFPRIHQDVLRITGEQLQEYAQKDEGVFTIPNPATASTKEFSFSPQAKRTIPSARLELAFTELMRLKQEKAEQLSINATVIRDARSYGVTLVEGLRLRTEKPDEYQKLISPKPVRADQQRQEDITKQTELRKAIALELLLTGENITEYTKLYQQFDEDARHELDQVAQVVFNNLSNENESQYKMVLAQMLFFVHNNRAPLSWMLETTNKTEHQLRKDLRDPINKDFGDSFFEDLQDQIDKMNVPGVGSQYTAQNFVKELLDLNGYQSASIAREFMRETVFTHAVAQMIQAEFNNENEKFDRADITFIDLIEQAEFFSTFSKNLNDTLFLRQANSYNDIDQSFSALLTKTNEGSQRRIVFLACFIRDLLDYSSSTGNSDFNRKQLLMRAYVTQAENFGVKLSQMISIYNYLALHAEQAAQQLKLLGFDDRNIISYPLHDFREFLQGLDKNSVVPIGNPLTTNKGFISPFGSDNHYVNLLSLKGDDKAQIKNNGLNAQVGQENSQWFRTTFDNANRAKELKRMWETLQALSTQLAKNGRLDDTQLNRLRSRKALIKGESAMNLSLPKSFPPRIELLKNRIQVLAQLRAADNQKLRIIKDTPGIQIKTGPLGLGKTTIIDISNQYPDDESSETFVNLMNLLFPNENITPRMPKEKYDALIESELDNAIQRIRQEVEKLTTLISNFFTDEKNVDDFVSAFLDQFFITEKNQAILKQPKVTEKRDEKDYLESLYITTQTPLIVNWSREKVTDTDFLQGLYGQMQIEVIALIETLDGHLSVLNQHASALKLRTVDTAVLTASYLKSFDKQLKQRVVNHLTHQLQGLFPQGKTVENAVAALQLGGGDTLAAEHIVKQMTELGNQIHRGLYTTGNN